MASLVRNAGWSYSILTQALCLRATRPKRTSIAFVAIQAIGSPNEGQMTVVPTNVFLLRKLEKLVGGKFSPPTAAEARKNLGLGPEPEIAKTSSNQTHEPNTL